MSFDVATGKGIVTLETEGLPPVEVERLRKILHSIVKHGVLGIAGGAMTIHFSDQGLVSTIEVLKRWRNVDKQSTPL